MKPSTRTTRVLIAATLWCGLFAASAPASGQQGAATTPLQSLVRDAETATSLVAHGKLFYNADQNKRPWGEYCALSVTLANRGEFREAIREASKALFLGQTSGDSIAVTFASRDLAYAYVLAGDLDKAEEWAKNSLTQLNRSRIRDRATIVVPVHKVLGDVALKRNEIETALKHYRVALPEARYGHGGVDAEIPLQLSIAIAEMRRKQFDAARDVLSKIDNSNARWAPFVSRAHGQLALSQGDHAKAVEHYSRAISTLSASGNPYDMMWMQHGLGQALMASGERAKALEAMLRAIEFAKQLRSTFQSAEFRAGFFGEVQSIYDDAIGLLLDDKRHEDALKLSEESRARALLDVLRGRGPAEQLRTAEAASGVPSGTVAVVYHVLADRIAAWTIRDGATVATTIPLGRNELATLTNRFRRAITNRSSDVQEQGRKLHDLLIRPLGLKDSESMIVVPHKALHYLPMHALVGAGGYLVEERAVGTAPSLNAMLAISGSEKLVKSTLFALGNPDLEDPALALPGAEEEVKSIGGLFGGAQVFVRNEATKPRFVAQAPGNGFVHLAAHATVDEVDPMYSAIRLARGGQPRGELEARDILELNLSSAQLVTLSGCESGLGKVKGGDEFYGFKRAFLSAGARSLLISLWPVEDQATAALMTAFYRELPNRTKAEALRQAQLSVLKSAGRSDPLFWAPFILVGEWQ